MHENTSSIHRQSRKNTSVGNNSKGGCFKFSLSSEFRKPFSMKKLNYSSKTMKKTFKLFKIKKITM